MKLDVRPLVDGQSLSFSHTMDLSALDFAGRVRFGQPVAVEGTVCKRSGILYLEIHWLTWADFRCDRCDTPFSRRMSQTAELILTEGDAGERDDTAPLTGGYCDIEGIVTPAVILAVEYKNLCSEDCGGSEWITEEV